jgi:hypothetical protein
MCIYLDIEKEGITWLSLVHEALQKKVFVQFACIRPFHKQLEFIGGGWVQNDEALVTLSGAIDQMTEGHTFLRTKLGITPARIGENTACSHSLRSGYQIDPFGHSIATPTLYKLMGFKNMVSDTILFG